MCVLLHLLLLSFRLICLLQLDEDDAVFDVLDDDEYAELVESRRNGQDFVVDDGTYLFFIWLMVALNIAMDRGSWIL